MELIIENFVGIFRNGGAVSEVVQYLLVLGDLGYDKIDVLAWFFLEDEIHA